MSSIKVHELFAMQPEIRTPVPDVAINTTRHIGVELEVESAGRVPTDLRYWSVITDRSLRNDGRELVFRQPLAGRDVRNALHELAGVLHNNPQLSASERTSLHVHVDVRDLTTSQVAQVLVTYIATESALYKMGGKARYDNIYCPGITSALEQMSMMRKIVHGNDDQFFSACHDWCKYTGINLRSIVERGSIEFRAHEGTLEIRRIRNWVNVLLSLVDYAVNKNSIEEILEDVNSGAVALLSKVYGMHQQLLLQDGDYLNYFKNNMTNLIDLLNDDKYEPEYLSASESSDASVSDVLAQLRAAVQRAGE